MARDVKPQRTGLWSVEELLKDQAFRPSFLKASEALALRFNSIHIMQAYCLLEILQELKEMKLILKSQAGIPETEEEREVRIDKEVKEANKRKLNTGKGK